MLNLNGMKKLAQPQEQEILAADTYTVWSKAFRHLNYVAMGSQFCKTSNPATRTYIYRDLKFNIL